MRCPSIVHEVRYNSRRGEARQVGRTDRVWMELLAHAHAVEESRWWMVDGGERGVGHYCKVQVQLLVVKLGCSAAAVAVAADGLTE